MKKTVLQLLKRYRGNAPLINSMAPEKNSGLRSLACYLSGQPDGKNGMEDRTEEVFYLDLPKSRLYWHSLSTVKKVAELIDREEVDLVVCQFRRVMPIGALAAKLSRRKPKVIGVVHGLVGGRVTPGKKLLNYFTYGAMEKVVSVSECGAEDILRANVDLPREKVIAIQNGINTERFTGPADRGRNETFGENLSAGFIFSMVGRLAPKKNHYRVIRALSRLAGDHENVRLAIAGTGPEQAKLQQLVSDCGLTDKVSFLGQRGDVPDILKNSDAFLFPSIHEGLPLALMEAMVTGLPVLTSKAGGLVEVVSDESLGLLVDPLSEEQIEAGMRELLEMPEDQRRTLGHAGREHILNHFTDRRMAAEYEDLYRQLIGGE